MQADWAVIMSKAQVERLELYKRGPTLVGKHVAKNDTHLRELIKRLDDSGDKEAADTICWLIWWLDLKDVQIANAWSEVKKQHLQDEITAAAEYAETITCARTAIFVVPTGFKITLTTDWGRGDMSLTYREVMDAHDNALISAIDRIAAEIRDVQKERDAEEDA
ncbi:MAG: hypothetical protein DSY80_07450 [Desulfocapsa sp.]|nr:MAG: hypothetical protein DSY80_07450 [Desulfocapsa sp.]